MKRFAFRAVLMIGFGVGCAMPMTPANAVGICKCDSARGFEPVCLPLCKQANEKTTFFRPAVFFGSDAKVSNDKSPLNGTSLKFLYLANPTRLGMEQFRQFLEKHRLIAEKKYRKVLQSYKAGKLDEKAFITAEKTRDEALVNYQHGMRAYLTIPSER